MLLQMLPETGPQSLAHWTEPEKPKVNAKGLAGDVRGCCGGSDCVGLEINRWGKGGRTVRSGVNVLREKTSRPRGGTQGKHPKLGSPGWSEVSLREVTRREVSRGDLCRNHCVLPLASSVVE